MGSSRFQPGEGPSRGLLRDYEPSDGTFSSTIVDAAVIVSGMITASPASRTVSNYARALLIGL